MPPLSRALTLVPFLLLESASKERAGGSPSRSSPSEGPGTVGSVRLSRGPPSELSSTQRCRPSEPGGLIALLEKGALGHYLPPFHSAGGRGAEEGC